MDTRKNHLEIMGVIFSWLENCRNNQDLIQSITIGQVEELIDMFYQLERKEKEKNKP